MAELIRIGTRGSPLALRQTGMVAEALREAGGGSEALTVELVAIRTSGDRLAGVRLVDVGGKGLFVREIDEALLERRVDVAVHSLKDLPVERPAGVVVAAYPARVDPRDALVSADGSPLLALPQGARVGTGSLRRQVQLLERRPDLVVEAVRGNVDTRLRKLETTGLHAVVLAAAGLARLGLKPPGVVLLAIEEMLPAVGQGILAVETRTDEPRLRELVGRLDDAPTRRAALAERAFLAAIGGSCTTPLAAHAREDAAGLRLDALVASPDGTRVLRDGELARGVAPDEVGRRVAGRLLDAGAGALMRAGFAG